MNFTARRGPVVAVKTLHAIETQLAQDQGNKFRELLRELMPQAEDAYSSVRHGFRTHLGASFIGRECERALWYGFRWVGEQKHSGRMLRLFNRGHLEEPRFVALLKMIGCEVWQYDDKGEQFRVSYFGGHYGGSLDAVLRGCPDDQRPVLGEFKTHGEKSFDKLAGSNWKEYLEHVLDQSKHPREEFTGKGVREAKPEHYVQMQTYMGGYQLPRALYMAVNKNTDSIYAELVDYDHETYLQYLDRARRVIEAGEPPKKVNNSPGWYTCRFCDYRLICHSNGDVHRTCRTCIHGQPIATGEWVCTEERRNALYGGDAVPLTKDDQLRACPDYRHLPKL